MNYSLSPIIR